MRGRDRVGLMPKSHHTAPSTPSCVLHRDDSWQTTRPHPSNRPFWRPERSVRYPEHQSMPILRKIHVIGLPRFRIELQEPTTSTSEFSGNAVNEWRRGFERWSSPVCKGLPVYVPSNSFGETLGFDQSVRRLAFGSS